jgi:transmembrane sensor
MEHLEPDVDRMDVAAHWLLRLRDDCATDKDVAEWLHWYESDERNTQAFDAIQEFWQQTGQLAAGPEGVDRIARLGRIDPVRSAVYRPAALGIAAGFLLAVGAVFLLFPSVRLPTSAPLVDVHEPLVRHTQLPDSSSVDLAADSSVAVEYTATQRTLDLQNGEAFFSVAPNHARPFVVKATGLRVRAVGTKFNVREAGDRVVVTVAEGTVDIYAAEAVGQVPAGQGSGIAGALRLTAGNEVTWVIATGKRIVRATDPERALAWRYGRLEYIDEPLSAVVSDVNRYSSRKLVIQDPALAHLTYTGTVLIGSVDEWLRAMPREFPVKVISNDSSIAIVASEPENIPPITQEH